MRRMSTCSRKILPLKMAAGATKTTKCGSISKDVAVPCEAGDTISSIRWSQAADHLAVASWDGKVRIYDVATDLAAKGVALITATAPLFCCDWSLVSLGFDVDI